MQTAIQKAIEDLKGYKTFTSIIDVDFVVVLLNTYVKMEKQQIIDAVNQIQFDDIDGMGICDTNTKGEQYYNETYGSKGSDECYFEPTTNTSSATICKHCGREKFLHKQ